MTDLAKAREYVRLKCQIAQRCDTANGGIKLAVCEELTGMRGGELRRWILAVHSEIQPATKRAAPRPQPPLYPRPAEPAADPYAGLMAAILAPEPTRKPHGNAGRARSEETKQKIKAGKLLFHEREAA